MSLRKFAQDAPDTPWDWHGGYPQRVTNGAATLVAEVFDNPDAPPSTVILLALAPEMAALLCDVADALRSFVDDYDFHAADYLADRVDGEEARVLTARTIDELLALQRVARPVLARFDALDAKAGEGA